MPRKPVTRIATAFAAALAMSSALPIAAPAAASEIQVVGRWTYDTPADLAFNPAIVQGSLILNPVRRTGFQFFVLNGARTLVRVFDLDTFATRSETIVTQDLGAAQGRPTAIRSWIHGIDADSNIVYLPYFSTQPRGKFGGVIAFSGDTGTVVEDFGRTEMTDPTAALGVGEDETGAPTVNPCTSASCLPQTIGIAPTITAMEFVPAEFSPQSKPKLLMLWQEDTAPGADGNLLVSWATQWDLTQERQDFSYRIQSCTVRYAQNQSSQQPLVIFQARLGGAIYLGCNAQGNTGQVVRIKLDTSGQPSGEETYPGPVSVADVLADKDSDRVIQRVSTPFGDSYWVFSGDSSTYTGIVATTIGQGATSTGIDPSTGRLYVMAPQTSRDNEIQQGGLMISDLRRAPAPQVSIYPDVVVPNPDRDVFVDTHHKSGAKRLFIHPTDGKYYVIIEDRVPPGFDEPLSDLDRFTLDVEEQEGVTSANYTGAGHAYGSRTLLVGGLLGVVPIGADVSGNTLRFVASAASSPCQNPDREVRFGSIPFATLANNLTSAEATAGSTEGTTTADVREPAARCYGPGDWDQVPFLSEDPNAASEEPDADHRSRADQTAGTDWPFLAATCSGDGEDEKVTTVKPLDREPLPAELPDPVPSNAPDLNELSPTQLPKAPAQADEIRRRPRDTAIRFEDNRARVACIQSGAEVNADALAGAMTMEGLPPGIEFVHTASAGGFTRMYLDPDRGLVSETIAYTRGINIGGKVTIDVAYSKATAWAGGRPGTAGTSLERRVCGVSVPSAAGTYSVIPLDTPAGKVPHDPEPIDLGDPLYDATKDVDNPVDGGKGVSLPLGSQDPYNYSTDDRVVPPAVQACADAPAPADGTPLGPRPFMEIMNRALGVRGRATVPEPDKELRQGSPGGYFASLQKDRYQRIGALSVSNDSSTQVPAFELQIVQDDPRTGRARQLFQFAGVDASATYGIYLLNPVVPPIDNPDDDLPPSDITDDLVDYTGGPLPTPPAPPTGSGPPPPTGVFAPVTYLYRGVSFLARSWQDAGLAGAVLILLSAPLFLLGRRRALRSLP